MKGMLNKCVVCKRLEGRSFAQPPTASLPEFRVKPAPPFSRVGVDFAGPFFVKAKNGQTRKVYNTLFTCCMTRAVYLELVDDLSVETFRRRLRQFIARRGIPVLMVSDNAKKLQGHRKGTAQTFQGSTGER